MKKDIYFFIGTEAELIKVFPIMIEFKSVGITFKVISSGQNDISSSDIFLKTQCGNVDLELSSERNIIKSAIGLLIWWVTTYKGSYRKIREAFPDCDFSNSYMIVHGDTVSTYMGARIGKKLGMTVCHVEAGLRSYNLFSPFPEEIDRLLTSRIARIHFAPGALAADNLCHAKGCIVNIGQNTLLDSYRISENVEEIELIHNVIYSMLPYFVLVMHRQENLANEKFVRDVINNVIEISKKYKCVLILHTITKNALERMDLLDSLSNKSNIVLLPRVDYFSFMKLLREAEFVITDGGSNQEELSYMGKPTLVLRRRTERPEGLGDNAMLYNDISDIIYFASSYTEYKHKAFLYEQPSKTIVNYLKTNFENMNE